MPLKCAEDYAVPIEGELGVLFARRNEFNETFFLRWGRIRFELFWGVEADLKVVLKVRRSDGDCEKFIVDTDPYDVQWSRHKRATRDFFIHPFPPKEGRVIEVGFSFEVHVQGQSILSRHEYLFMDRCHWDEDRPCRRAIAAQRTAPNDHRTGEADAAALQADVDRYNRDFDALQLVPKFTKGQPAHPYHPKRYIHDRIDQLIRKQQGQPGGSQSIKVCVDCIDDGDFVNHLIHASENGVAVQCVVDWRKMTLTHSDRYLRLKRSKVDLLGVFCTPRDPLIEVAPDMHTKFIIFGSDDCILGSFNITFDRWGANWESGMAFHSPGVCRLLDNVFQSIRGGVVQRYGVDPLSHFNLLYTFGRQATMAGKYYRPQHAILSEINRAKRSIKACLFLLGELQGEYHDSVVDALIAAKRRGVEVHLIINGHMARQGDPGKEYTMEEELRRPLTPAVARLHRAAVPMALAYGVTDHRVPYCPLHSKYCVIDDYIVLEGSFNWYNTSTFSHDLLVVAASPALARAYLHEFHQILRLFRFPSLSFKI